MMSLPTEPSRPTTVVFATAMMYVGSFMYAVGVVINLIMFFRPDEVQLLFGSPVNDWYWIVNGGLDFILVIGFAWVARMAYRGDYGAGMTISLLAVLNIVFSMFRLGHIYGWITLAISIAVLAANLSSSAQEWYRAHLPARPAA
jgi:ABC-type Na+ efflux pump permease subunit